MKQINIINQNIDSRYLDFFRSLYGNERNINYFVSDIRLSMDYCISTKRITTITLTDDEVLLGHCSIIAPLEKTAGAAYFGFFDLTGDKEDFKLFWDSVLGESRKQDIKKLAGPINGSIWFPNRFIATSDDSPLFKGELPTKLSYHKQLSSIPNGRSVAFSSGVRNHFDTIIELTRKPYENLKNAGYQIEILHAPTNEILKEVQALAESAFLGQSGLHGSISTDYFLKFYNQEKIRDLFGLYTVRKNKKLIAFCSIFYEDKKRLIFKTIAVHPAYQGHGIGGGIAHLVHLNAKEQGAEAIIYALVRDENNIKKFPKDDVSIIRTYSLFEFDV